MKVRINKDGSMEFDVNNVEEAAALVRIAAGAAEPAAAKEKKTKPAKNAPELNEIQFKTWSYLVDNDSDTGVHISAIARHLGIKKDNACWWCQTLLQKGYAMRVSRGYYRALV